MRLKLFITNQGKILPNIQHVDCINVEKFLHAGYVVQMELLTQYFYEILIICGICQQ